MQQALGAHPVVASKTIKICTVKMTAARSRPVEPSRLQPYSVTLPPLEATAH